MAINNLGLNKMLIAIIVALALILIIVLYVARLAKRSTNLTRVLSVDSAGDILENFGVDLPNGDGSDPTDSQVDYSFLLDDRLKPALKRGVPIWSTRFREDVGKYIFDDSENKGVILKPSAEFNDTASSRRLVNSYRLTSKRLFHGGLFIADIAHIPTGAGVWPAFWLNGFIGAPNQVHSNVYSQDLYDKAVKCFKPVEGRNFKYGPGHLAAWPAQGEIDVVEQIGGASRNSTSIHAGYNCFVADSEGNNSRTACGFDGPIRGCNNDYPAETKSLYDGIYRCRANGEAQISGPEGSFGVPFNERGGGVYVLDWQPREYMIIWFFPRGEIPLGKDGPLGSAPAPASWDEKYINSHYTLNGCDFGYQEIIVNLAFGGGWGSVDPAWEGGEYIAKCESVDKCFPEAFWKFKSIKVFQDKSRGHSTVW